MANTALLIIDMQNAYFNNSALDEHKTELIEACNELVAHAKQQSWPVFTIRTVHKKDKSTWTLNTLDDQSGYLFEDSTDAQIVDGLDTTGTTEVIKTRDSAFYGTDLLTQLRTRSIDQVILCGVSTHSCVMLTAADAYAANLRVILARDAICSHDPNYHTSTLEMLQQEYRQQSLSNTDILKID